MEKGLLTIPLTTFVVLLMISLTFAGNVEGAAREHRGPGPGYSMNGDPFVIPYLHGAIHVTEYPAVIQSSWMLLEMRADYVTYTVRFQLEDRTTGRYTQHFEYMDFERNGTGVIRHGTLTLTYLEQPGGPTVHTIRLSVKVSILYESGVVTEYDAREVRVHFEQAGDGLS